MQQKEIKLHRGLNPDFSPLIFRTDSGFSLPNPSICLLMAREGREEGEFIWVWLSFVTCSNLTFESTATSLLQVLECKIEGDDTVPQALAGKRSQRGKWHMQNLANLKTVSLQLFMQLSTISINGKDSWCAHEELLQTSDWESAHHNHGIVLQRDVIASTCPHRPFIFTFSFTSQGLQIQSSYVGGRRMAAAVMSLAMNRLLQKLRRQIRAASIASLSFSWAAKRK